jgi:hypothetical protein
LSLNGEFEKAFKLFSPMEQYRPSKERASLMGYFGRACLAKGHVETAKIVFSRMCWDDAILWGELCKVDHDVVGGGSETMENGTAKFFKDGVGAIKTNKNYP